MKKTSIDRRRFLKISGLTGAALTLGFYFPAVGEKKGRVVNVSSRESEGILLTSWITIDKSGGVTLYDHRAEMGQGSYQAVPQMIAEELEVDPARVNILFAPASQTKFGSQVTGGSSTVRESYMRLLKTGASARVMLIGAAARKWNVSKDDCYAEDGMVIHRPSGKKSGYGDLVEEAAKMKAPEEVKLKDRKDYKYIGKPLVRRDASLKTNGSAVFGIDKILPGMLYAVVERNPRFIGKVKSFDDSQAMKVAGVKKVFKVTMPVFASTREGVAVVADNTWAAMQGRKALKVEWDDEGFEHISTDELYQRMRDDLNKPGLSARTAGDFEKAYGQVSQKVEAVYETPYEAHACMEPINCTAYYHDNKCEIWGPIQGPDWIQKDISDRFKLPVDNVTVNMTFLGGGFGRKAFTDYTCEAVFISKEMNAPVQVVWTREDDLSQGPFRPGAIYSCKAGLDGARISAFSTKMAAQNMDHQSEGADKNSYNGSTVEGLLKPYFESIPNYSFGDVPTESVIPVMWWRSVYSSTNGFAYESFMDELAHAAVKDPLDFRRENLIDDRSLALIDKLEEISGWKKRGKNEGWGVAVTECFGSKVGEVVKVSRKSDGKIKVEKVYALIDCGWYVNPDTIKAQVEGSIVMALGAATVHAMQFKDGQAALMNFNTYPMPRIAEIPDTEVHVMENDEKPGGVGEPGLPPLAPALCNAIFDLTGNRIRKLPFDLNSVS